MLPGEFKFKLLKSVLTCSSSQHTALQMLKYSDGNWKLNDPTIDLCMAITADPWADVNDTLEFRCVGRKHGLVEISEEFPVMVDSFQRACTLSRKIQDGSGVEGDSYQFSYLYIIVGKWKTLLYLLRRRHNH